MSFLLLAAVVVFALADTGGGELTVERGGDGSTFRWVMVTASDGSTAFMMYRGNGTGYFRGECWDAKPPARSSLERLLAMPFGEYYESPIHIGARGAPLDCGEPIVRRLVEEWGDDYHQNGGGV